MQNGLFAQQKAFFTVSQMGLSNDNHIVQKRHILSNIFIHHILPYLILRFAFCVYYPTAAPLWISKARAITNVTEQTDTAAAR